MCDLSPRCNLKPLCCALSMVLAASPVWAAAPPSGGEVEDPDRRDTSTVTTRPQLLAQVALRYPDDAPPGAHGDVSLRVSVDTAGLVTAVEVLSGPAVFHAEATRAAYQLRFSPAQRDGAPVASRAVVYFHFAPPRPAPPPGSGDPAELIVEAEDPDRQATRSQVTLGEVELEQSSGEDLASVTEDIPGAARAGGTSSASKPIIRGQSERRLLLLFDGVRHESQKWGPDHAPEIDPFSAGSVRVIKGAAGARFGPDAIGGVMLIDPPPMRSAPGVGGKLLLMGASNGGRGYGALRLDGVAEGAPRLSYRLEGNYSRSAALQAPDYVLGNTASAQWNLGAAAQYQGDGGGQLRLSYQHHDFLAGIFYGVRAGTPDEFLAQYEAGAPVGAGNWTPSYDIDRPYQDVTHDRVILHGMLPMGVWMVEASYAFQINLRREFEQVREGIEGPQYDFTLRTHSLDAHTHHDAVPLGEAGRLALEGGAGVQGIFQENVYRGYDLLPNFRGMGGGVFAFERLSGERAAVEVGARYDGLFRSAFLDDEAYDSHQERGALAGERCDFDGAVARCPEGYSTGSLSLGGTWAVVPETVELKLDLSSASRFPDADELYLIGYAPSFPVYAQGDPDLGVETTWGASPTVGLRLPWLEAEASAYLSYVRDFIYFAPDLGPGGEPRFEVTIRGAWPIYAYRPVDASFYGADGGLTVGPQAPVRLRLQGAVVRAHDLATGDFLINTPPDRGRATLSAHPAGPRWMEDAAISLIADAVARQSRTDPVTDFVPAPEGYVLLGASAGAALTFWEDRPLRVSVEALNLLDRAYRDYTSLVRYYADQPGRDIRLRLGTSFGPPPPKQQEETLP